MARAPKKEQPGLIRVHGPYVRGDKFQVITYDVNNKQVCKVIATLAAAQAYADRCKKRIVVARAIEGGLQVPDYDGTKEWWIARLAEVTKTMLEAVDLEVVKRCVSMLPAVSKAAVACGQLSDAAKLERDFAELRKQVEEVVAARKYGTRFSGPNKTAAESVSAGLPV